MVRYNLLGTSSIDDSWSPPKGAYPVFFAGWRNRGTNSLPLGSDCLNNKWAARAE